jgi:hypothetical protein
MPAAMHLRSSPFIACAVSATMGHFVMELAFLIVTHWHRGQRVPNERPPFDVT